MMTKIEFRQAIDIEIYEHYKNDRKSLKKISLLKKIILCHFFASYNAVFLIRKMQYYFSRGRIFKFYAKIIHYKLIKKYGISINMYAKIGLGLKIPHPNNIVITNCLIGKNFTIYHGCTIGQKSISKRDCIINIGDDCIVYCNSSIIGCSLERGTIVGAHSLVLNDTVKSGVYTGCPAELRR